MKKFTFVSCLFLLAVFTASCQFPGAKIKPGDKIGEMEFINEYENCQAPNILNDLCTEKELTAGTCKVSLKTFWISVGWTAGSWEELDLEWKDSEWSATFNGQEIDLPAFGFYDMDWTDPDGNAWKARVWNVCIKNPAPGKYSVVYEFLFVNGVWRGNHVVPLNFTVVAP